MIPSDISNHIVSLKERFEILERRLTEPDIFTKQIEYKEVSRERQRLIELLSTFDRWIAVLKQIEENKNILQTEEDEEMKQMVAIDLELLQKEVSVLENKVKIFLMPPDPNDNRDIIVEMRPAAGGDEAGLFAGELYRAYCRFAEIKGWKHELLDFTSNAVGGIKEVIFSITGDRIYSYLKYESGVHRVQRIPLTEAGGRIHTSTITVAVLPEAEEVEIDIKPDDLRFDYFRSSGPGGQNVNRTDSAVRVTHIPTGVSVASQQEKSQHRNKATALRILRARLLETKQQEEASKHADSKRKQIGTGDRSERIRTYNFPQNRITDHRFSISVFNIPAIMDGQMEDLFQEIMKADSERSLSELIGKTF
ncbi:MAG: peptide chain release factor 1 [Lentisphaerae bacterium GWF2_38_69]|nr:MAG: peptide chain release factor 1 [Lentisphaerae bacterium GWF2_38_69]